jgi:hypothetical protein
LPALLPQLDVNTNEAEEDPEPVISNLAVLLHGKAALPFFDNNQSKTAKSPQAELDTKHVKWWHFSGAPAIRDLANWIESEGKVRVWKRKMAQFARDEDTSGVESDVDPYDSEDEAAQEVEEKAAHDFVGVLKAFANYIEIFGIEDPPESSSEEDEGEGSES